MKRFLILGVVALAAASASVETASAWINSNLGIGANWSVQAGGNDFLCGLIRCGQPCGPDFGCGQVGAFPRSHGMAPVAPPCPPGGHPGMHGHGGPVAAPVQAFRYPYASYYHYGYGR